jgi:hypothetical protein
MWSFISPHGSLPLLYRDVVKAASEFVQFDDNKNLDILTVPLCCDDDRLSVYTIERISNFEVYITEFLLTESSMIEYMEGKHFLEFITDISQHINPSMDGISNLFLDNDQM